MKFQKGDEFGILVKPYEEEKRVIHWMVTAKSTASNDNELYGFKKGDPVYKTSMGWQKGLTDKSDYFEPTPLERSMRPAHLRASAYSDKKWPTWPAGIH
jgi:hypothetical protein